MYFYSFSLFLFVNLNQITLQFVFKILTCHNLLICGSISDAKFICKKKAGPTYSDEDLLRAVRDVGNKVCTFTQAEEQYGVPKSVIYHGIKGRKTPIDIVGAGRTTDLSNQAEIDLVNCLKARARIGYPCNMEDTFSVVTDFVKANNLRTPFTDEMEYQAKTGTMDS